MHNRALRSVALQFWVNGVVFASFIPRLPEIRRTLGVDLTSLGLLLTLSSVGGLVGSALSGRAIERFGSKRVMIAGSLGLICSLPALGFATHPAVFLAGLSSMHFFDVVTDVSMNLQGSWISGHRAMPVMNRLHGLWSLGSVVGGLVAARSVAASIPMGTHLVVVSLTLLVVMLYIAPGLLPSDGPANHDAAHSGAGRRFGFSSLTIGLGALGVAAIGIEAVPADWAAFRLAEDLSTTAGIAGLGFVAFTTGMVAGRFGGDMAQARLGRRTLSMLAATQAAIGLAVATLVPVTAVALGGFLVAGIGVAVVFPALYDDAAKAPGRPGAALGALTAGSRIGLLVIPVLVGALADTPWLGVGEAMALIALPCAMFIAVYGRRHAEASSDIPPTG